MVQSRKKMVLEPCVGTVDENKAAALRIVVNRKVDEVHKTIYFHTDNRSRKYIDLIKDNRISLLFYDARQRSNCCKANATLHTNDALSNDRWRATSPQARLGYMTLDLKHEVRPTTWDMKNTLPSQNQPMKSNPFEKTYCSSMRGV
jgi:pyridoxine/pyridoxamine 5'-phosphate oxidase